MPCEGGELSAVGCSLPETAGEKGGLWKNPLKGNHLKDSFPLRWKTDHLPTKKRDLRNPKIKGVARKS